MLFLIYRYLPEEHAKIGEDACIHGSAAAARHFSKKLGSVSVSSVKSIKTSYIEARQKRSADSESIKSLPTLQPFLQFITGRCICEFELYSSYVYSEVF